MEQKGTPPAQEAQVASKTQSGKEKLAPSSKPSSTAQEYTITAGDTLSMLALRYYGNAQKWPKIYEANKSSVKNPNYIYIGQKIVIPADQASA
jgi:nucleoid-associated protein YgaU